jgi:GNAT superfamily N-acetyltransferase
MNATEPVPFISYKGFPPLERGSYVYGIEKFEDTLGELIPCHALHWEETEGYLGEPMNVDYARYVAMERQAQLVMFTARTTAGELAGYVVFTLGPHANVQHRLLACEASLFVHPDHRGAVVIRLLDHAEDCLRKMGVHYVTIGDKSPCGGASLEKLLERRSYQAYAVTYIKTLGDSDGTVQ